MKCWNCLTPATRKDHVCSSCGQALKPNLMQMTTARSRLEYLLQEASLWSFLAPAVKDELASVYQNRLARLASLEQRGAMELWPETDWTAAIWSSPLPVAEPATAPTESSTAAIDASSEAISPATGAVSAVTEALSPAELDLLLDKPKPDLLPLRVTESPSSEPTAVAALEHAPEFELTAAAEPLRAAVTAPPVAELESSMASKPSWDESAAPDDNSTAAKLLAEADIRWFHSLGALLVVAAVVGWLRATWDGYGKNVAGLLIVASPAVLHAVAYQMRQSVPLSARLLAILAGVLTPPALLAVEIFDFLPPEVSGRDYWTLALFVSGAVLAWQAQAMKERVPLFLGVLCIVLAGWSQGALATSALCLMVGFLLGTVRPEPSDSNEQLAWKQQLQGAGLAAGVFGSFATLLVIRPEQGSLTPLIAFTGALIYLHLPTLTRQGEVTSENRVALQACVTVLGIILMRAMLDVPVAGIGLYTLLAGGLFLSARPEHPAGVTALRIGSLLGLTGLALGFFSSSPVPFGQPGSDPIETVLRFLLAFVGAGLFGYLSRQAHLETQAVPLGLGALLSTFGGWYHLFLMLCQPVEGSYFAQNGQLAPLVASFGLWVALWLVGSRWLRRSEQQLVATVTLPVLLLSMVCCVGSALSFPPAALAWSSPLLFLGAVALAWERGLLAPKASAATTPDDEPVEDDAKPLWGDVESAARLCLPRMVLWSLSLGAAFSEFISYSETTVLLQLLGVALLLSPAVGYRQPGLEMVWLAAPLALFEHWSNSALPPQIPLVTLLFLASWAAGTQVRAASFLLAAACGTVVILGSSNSALPLALLCLPLAFALAFALPVPGRGSWSPAAPAQHGFDLLLNAALFLPLELARGSGPSFVATAAIPVAAYLLARLGATAWGGRFISPSSPSWLVLAGFLWSLGQGPQESGLLLLLAAALVFLRKPALEHIQAWDLSNGLAILGAAWLVTDGGYLEPHLTMLSLGVLASECLALITKRWRPDLSNTAFLLILLLLGAGSGRNLPEVGLALTAGLLGAIRGLATARISLAVAGLLLFLQRVDHELFLLEANFRVRLMPLAFALILASIWLLLRPDHPSRGRLGFEPAAGLRVGLALLSIPTLLVMAVLPTLADFVWVLAVGCSCLILAYGLKSYPELRNPLKQAGAYILVGWVGVSLSRAAVQVPWQLTALVVGTLLVAVGVRAERNRKRPKGFPPPPSSPLERGVNEP